MVLRNLFLLFFLEIEITNVVYIVSWFLKMKNHGGVTQFLMYDVQMMCSTLCDPNLFQENAIFFQQIFFPSTPPQNDRRSRSTHCFTLTNYITTEEKVFKKISHGIKKTSCSHSLQTFLKEAIYFTRIFITRQTFHKHVLPMCSKI